MVTTWISAIGGGGLNPALAAKGGKGKDKDKNKGKGKGDGKGKKSDGRTSSRDRNAGGASAAGGADDANKAKAKDGRYFCYFHNNGGCQRENCNFSHDTPPKNVKEAMTRPSRSQSPGGKGKGKGGKPQLKGKAKAKACPAVPDPPAAAGERAALAAPTKKFGGMKTLWCQKHLQGKCHFTTEQCPFPHIDQQAKDAIQAAIRINKAAGNDRQ